MGSNPVDSWNARDLQAGLKTSWLGHRLYMFDEIDSTNLWLKNRLTAETDPHGTVVLADAQRAGRGRLGKSWWSPAGTGLYTSALFYPERFDNLGITTLLAGVALAEGVSALTGIKVGLKWPNDAILHGKKFAGILAEAGTTPRPWLIIGIGINVSGPVPEELPNAGNLVSLGGCPVDRVLLWERTMETLERMYDGWLSTGNEPVLERWTHYNQTLGQRVLVSRAGHPPLTGIAEAIDSDGCLRVKSANGEHVRICGGEVSLRLADGRYAPS